MSGRIPRDREELLALRTAVYSWLRRMRCKWRRIDGAVGRAGGGLWAGRVPGRGRPLRVD